MRADDGAALAAEQSRRALGQSSVLSASTLVVVHVRRYSLCFVVCKLHPTEVNFF